jgi:DNA-binding IscR family transcriptional regulator
MPFTDMAGKSSRFTVGFHILTLFAHERGRALTSEYIAGSENTNPVVIRRPLGMLGKAGLVSTSEGAGGVTTLARPAERITLGDMYREVVPRPFSRACLSSRRLPPGVVDGAMSEGGDRRS